MNNKDYFVTHHNHEWHAKHPNAGKSSKNFKRKQDAYNYARTHAIKSHSGLFDKKMNGKINFGNNYKKRR